MEEQDVSNFKSCQYPLFFWLMIKTLVYTFCEWVDWVAVTSEDIGMKSSVPRDENISSAGFSKLLVQVPDFSRVGGDGVLHLLVHNCFPHVWWRPVCAIGSAALGNIFSVFSLSCF